MFYCEQNMGLSDCTVNHCTEETPSAQTEIQQGPAPVGWDETSTVLMFGQRVR